jgi:hypothetical protein
VVCPSYKIEDETRGVPFLGAPEAKFIKTGISGTAGRSTLLNMMMSTV